jgi:hypothetical protein
MPLWARKPFIAVRVLGDKGQYPAFGLRTETVVYSAAPTAVWSATLQPPLSRDWELSEFSVLAPEEVRALSAVALSESELWAKGLPILANHAVTHLDSAVVGSDMRDPHTFEAIKQVAQQHLDPAAEYKVVETLGSQADALALLDAIDSSDQLLLAGLARLLGATRVLSIANEPEEAAISLFVSMSAALEIIRLRLSDEAGKDMPYSAVYDYFRRTFEHGDEVAEYYEARYEERIIAVHPANKFGEFWTLPLMMGDVYHLRKSLIGFYRHILLGETKGW